MILLLGFAGYKQLRMKKILIFGAGKSATCLIDYLCNACEENNWTLLVCDADLALATAKIKGCKGAEAISINVNDAAKRTELIRGATIVISMLPPHLHFLVANDCVQDGKHLLTASYVDEKVKELEGQIRENNLLFLCEMGLDPGIDHMSAMKILDRIKSEGGKIISFKSHCGGLISPESDDNPWHYKITWNPGNIVMAGSHGAVYKSNTAVRQIPYQQIFNDCEVVDVPGLFPLAWYPNRDSLSYIKTYRLESADTFIRTTLRNPAFCRGWNNLVNIGLTDINDHEEIKNCKSYYEWYKIKADKAKSDLLNFQPEYEEQIDYLGLRSNDTIDEKIINSSLLLQHILEKKLAMKSHDKDMIVMLHEIGYRANGENKEIKSCLIVKGEDQIYTAMAKTVGLPLGIAAKLLLLDKIKLRGLHIPTAPEIYEAVLPELEKNGIKFNEG